MKTLKEILYFFTPREKKRAGLLLIMIIIMAFVDTMGVASILPFMAVITNPSIIETNFLLKNLFQISSVFEIKTIDEFTFFLGVLVFLILMFSLIFKAIVISMQLRFIKMQGHNIGKRLLEGYLNQPYNWFLNQNSAELSKTLISETGIIIEQGLTPISNLITRGVISIFLIILLFFVDIKLTLMVTFAIGGFYLIIFFFLKNFLDRIGKELLIANGLRFKSLSEAFGASKEIKLGRLEKIFINRFTESSSIYTKKLIQSGIIGMLPRYFIEAISFGGMLFIILYTISKSGLFVNSIPLISLYAFAGYRLIPSLQQIYQASTTLKFSNATIDKIFNDFQNLKLNNYVQNENKLSFDKKITLNQINFNYPNSSRTALKDISLTIPAKTKVGFIGPTGSGKTTAIDIILGLLEPQKGTLEIDGKIIGDKNRRSWQRSIGYVPQHIYLSDDTIAANIAFGLENNNINQDRVEKVSKIANLHKFVIDELPDKYQTITGERGVRLSGGQRQRIGIARALYHNPKVLVLDEATSALDNQTEKAVIDAINNLNKDITIIIIAHRLNTVKNCDSIFLLDKGLLKNKGTFNELIKDHDEFKE